MSLAPRRQIAATPREGFTLIELMVVVGIIALLSSIAIGSWRANEESSRIENGTQQIVNMLEGAKQRAIGTGKPVGIRLVLDYPDRESGAFVADPNKPPTDVAPEGTLRGRVCRQLMYVGPAATFTGTLNIHYRNPLDIAADAVSTKPNNGQNADVPPDAQWDPTAARPAPPITNRQNMRWVIDDASVTAATTAANRPWERLAATEYAVSIDYFTNNGNAPKDNAYYDPAAANPTVPVGVLQPGARIEIPAGSGDWYTISPEYFNPGGDAMVLVENYSRSRPLTIPDQPAYPAPGTINGSGNDVIIPRAYQRLSVPYRLQLGSAPLPEYGVVELPESVVIDLDGSAVKPADPLGALPTQWGDPATTDSTYPDELDLIFNPVGSMVDTQAADGLYYLLVTTLDDAVRARQAVDENGPGAPRAAHMQTRAIEAGGGILRETTVPFSVAGVSPVDDVPAVQDERRIIRINTQTGQSRSYLVNENDEFINGSGPPATAGSDRLADDPFGYARAGRLER